MDFSKLSSNDKLALYGAIAAVVGAILSLGVGLITILGALLVGFVVLQPQVAPNMSLPGSKGSLMLIGGGVAAVFAVLSTISWLGYALGFGLYGIFALVATAGSLVMAWAGWQQFQSEGGKFQLGSSGGTSAAPPPPAPMAPPAEPMSPPPAAPMPPPTEMSPGPAGSMGGTDEDESRG